MARSPLKDFDAVVREALDDMIEHGFDGTERVAYWEEQLRRAAESTMTPASALENDLREALAQAYRRDVERGGVLLRHPGVSKYTLAKLRPELQRELHKRILASAQLIKLDRERVIGQTIQRFSGWATSIPEGGSRVQDKKEERERVRSGMAGLKFKERRVLIDQTHKLNAAINDVVAKGGGAIAAKWRSHYHQAGYDYREEHKEREIESDKLPYLIRDSWAAQNGYVKLGGSKWLDDMTQPGEEVFCRCVIGSTRVPLANVKRAFRRRYDGLLVNIRTVSGNRLSATPNHPVLTPEGWRTADSLNVGDYIVEMREKMGKISRKENVDDAVPTISEIFAFLNKRSRASVTKGIREEFYGDGLADGDVYTVTSDRTLIINRDTTSYHRCEKFGLPQTASAVPAISSLAEHGLGLWFAAMDGTHKTTAAFFNFCRFVVETQARGFLRCSEFNPSTLKTSFNCWFADAVLSGQGYPGRTASISGSEFDIWESLFVSKILGGLGFISNRNANFSQTTPDCSVRNLEALCQRHGIDPTLVRFSQITSVEKDFASTHVYDLQTEDGWFAANGLIIHNCYYTYIYNLRQLPKEQITAKGQRELDRVREALRA